MQTGSFSTPSISAYIPAVREQLSAARTYYVATAAGGGSDSNDGLTSGTPWLTIQKAIDVLTGETIDFGGQTVTVSVATGTYTGAVAITKPWTGGGKLVIQGDTSTPTNVLISTTSATAFGLAAVIPGDWDIKGFEIRTTTSGNCVFNNGVGQINLSNINFGACAGQHIFSAHSGGTISILTDYAISGGAVTHLYSFASGALYCISHIATITNNPNFSGAFAYAAYSSMLYATGNTYSITGSVTGKRYSSLTNAVIQTNGGGANYFPGNSSGSTDGFGVYA